MRCDPRFAVLAFVFVAQGALAQGVGSPSPTTTSSTGPGIDVTTTLYPRSPASTITQAGGGYPTQTAAVPVETTGIPVGNIIIYPSITGATFYDDNVFARNINRLSDWAFVVRPEIAWRSNNWANTQAAGGGFVEKRWYDKFNSEDQLNGGAWAGIVHQPDANTQLVGRVAYLHAHEDRGSSDTIGLNAAFVKPIAYDQVEAAGAINKRFGRVWTSVGAAAAWLHFSDPTLPLFGVISQAYRNGVIARVPARVGYVVAPLTSVFVEVSGHWRDFQVSAYDSSGYRVVGGMLFEPGPGARIRGEIHAGYMAQNYSGANFQNISTWTYGGALAFLVTQNLTAVFEGRRDAKEASLSGGLFANIPGDGVSVIETLAAFRADLLEHDEVRSVHNLSSESSWHTPAV
jgi:hypothetical protein